MSDQLWQVIRYEACDPVGADGQHRDRHRRSRPVRRLLEGAV